MNKYTQRRSKRNQETATNVSVVKNHKIFRSYLYLHWFSIMYSSVYIFECFSFIEYENKFRIAFIFTLFTANRYHSPWRRLHFLQNSCIKLSVRIEMENLMIFSLDYILNHYIEKICHKCYPIQIRSYLCRHKEYFHICFVNLKVLNCESQIHWAILFGSYKIFQQYDKLKSFKISSKFKCLILNVKCI